ncbi:MAG: ATP-dependent Clp protease adaptor ClpS [Bacteroidia bacterium]|jgi:ATP-dependent Clp protease adaptor protein ClpS|nr:ATP-dependent Clp protease adaptor ClpS [Bacteroidia bacterium]
MIYNTTKTQEFAELDVVTEDSKLYTITLYNDDVNTFEWVIECLTKYCGHDFIQAEQCATLVHYKGKCIVKSGSIDKLKPICEVLLEKGLSAEIN